MSNIYQRELLSKVAALMKDNTDSDIKITCNGHEWNVHKAIISRASEILANACHGPWKEGTEGKISQDEFDADAVRRMISFIYTCDYVVQGEEKVVRQTEEIVEEGDTETTDPNPGNINDILIAHVQVFGIADFNQMKLLRTLARDKFVAAGEKGWQAEGFIEVVKAVNKRGGEMNTSLRDALRDYATKHSVEMVQDTSLTAELAELDEAQDFAADMFHQIVHLRESDKAIYEQQIQTKDSEIVELNNQIKRLREDKQRIQGSVDSIIENANERAEHIEGVMDNLIKGLRSLPTECSNGRCDRSIQRLKFERKGHSRYGAGQGDWKIKCMCNAGLH